MAKKKKKKNITLKELSEIFHNIERAKNKVLESWSKLRKKYNKPPRHQRNDSNHELYNEKASTVHTTLEKYFTKKEITLVLIMPNALNYSVLNKS